ncbi:hypothetical protein MD484_g5427, partial [Candolleomyces efflorescens]
MQFFFVLVGLFASQVYASVLPFGDALFRRQFGPPECASQCAPLFTVLSGCTNPEDFSCVCKPDLAPSTIACIECSLASPILTPELRQGLATGADAYIATVVHVCKEIFGIEVPGGTVTIPDVPAPTDSAHTDAPEATPVAY